MDVDGTPARVSLEPLRRLALGLADGSGVVLSVGEGWHFAPATSTLQVDRGDLEKLSLDGCGGIVAHEIGHLLISRYLLFRDPLEASAGVLPLLTRHTLNTIEDVRVERWMSERFPGVDRWLTAARALDLAPSGPRLLVIAFLHGCLVARSPSSADPLPTAVEDALAATAAARAAMVTAHLPPVADADRSLLANDPAWIARYATEVVPRLTADVSPWLPPAGERLVRVLAARLWEDICQKVLPSVVALHALDQERLATALAASPALRAEGERALLLGQVSLTLATAVAPEGANPPGEPARALAERLLACFYEPAPPSVVCEALARGWHPTEARLPPLAEVSSRSGSDAYDQALGRVADQVQELTDALTRLLPARRTQRLRSDATSGSRLDLRRAMAFEADRRQHDLWLRRDRPRVPHVAFSLLVDLSGSMRGEKITGALAAAALFAETLTRLRLPFSIEGFQDVCLPFLTFDDALDDDARRHLATMVDEVSGRRPDGNNQPMFNDDGPCLLAAAERLLARPETDRLLVVCSDGVPEGRTSSEDDLTKAIAALSHKPLRVVALGVGPGTRHVTTYYRNARAEIAPGKLATSVAALLQESLRAG